MTDNIETENTCWLGDLPANALGRIAGNLSRRDNGNLLRTNLDGVEAAFDRYNIETDIESCSICFDNIKKNERLKTICGHVFHHNCIETLCSHRMTNTYKCPLCRENNLLKNKLTVNNSSPNNYFLDNHRFLPERTVQINSLVRSRNEIVRINSLVRSPYQRNNLARVHDN